MEPEDGDVYDMESYEEHGMDANDFADAEVQRDRLLEQQEMEDFEQVDEYYGDFGGSD